MNKHEKQILEKLNALFIKRAKIQGEIDKYLLALVTKNPLPFADPRDQ